MCCVLASQSAIPFTNRFNDFPLSLARDLTDIGCHTPVINGLQELDSRSKKGLGLSKQYKEGIVFMTYTTLTSGGRKGGKSRLHQLIDWCSAVTIFISRLFAPSLSQVWR